MKRLVYIILAIGISLCVLPIFFIIWAGNFAQRHGCRLDEAGIYPCIVDGTDWGSTLAAASLLGWILILTLPIAGILSAVFLVIFAVDLFLRWRRS